MAMNPAASDPTADASPGDHAMGDHAMGDQLLGGRVTVVQPEDGYRVAIDAVLLAAAVDGRPGERVLDLGCGVGSASLCLAWRQQQLRITGLDREPAFLACARANARNNGMGERIDFIAGDVLDPPQSLRGMGFDQAMANPPYLKRESASVSAHPLKAAATVEGTAVLADWIACARALLRPGGILTLIHRADRLGDVLGCLARGFGGIAVLPLHPKPGRAAKRILVRAQAGSGERLSILPGLILHDADGAFTAAAEAILRHGEALGLKAES
jgi:tRNA1(Val) A37 N6-methylase TrmN6